MYECVCVCVWDESVLHRSDVNCHSVCVCGNVCKQASTVVREICDASSEDMTYSKCGFFCWWRCCALQILRIRVSSETSFCCKMFCVRMSLFSSCWIERWRARAPEGAAGTKTVQGHCDGCSAIWWHMFILKPSEPVDQAGWILTACVREEGMGEVTEVMEILHLYERMKLLTLSIEKNAGWIYRSQPHQGWGEF